MRVDATSRARTRIDSEQIKDAMVLNDYKIPADRLARITQTERRTLDGQGHVVAPELIARVLSEFFTQ